MSAASVELRPWSRKRRWGFVALVFALQLALISWFGGRQVAGLRRAAPPFAVRFSADRVTELMRLNDPTLFALANSHGFSGAAWLNVPRPEYHAADWSEPPRWLTLPVERLGNVFSRFLPTNTAKPFVLAEKLEPVLAPEGVVAAFSLPQRSRLRIEGDLADRPLRSTLEPPSVPFTDILTPTVVQLTVDARGFTYSAAVLASSGSKDADQRALELAKAARFEPQPNPELVNQPATAGGLTWGRLVFDWHTTAPPTTNPPPAAP